MIKTALKEACQFYIELVKLGAAMQYFDVGGGLGVDYDGEYTPSLSMCVRMCLRSECVTEHKIESYLPNEV